MFAEWRESAYGTKSKTKIRRVADQFNRSEIQIRQTHTYRPYQYGSGFVAYDRNENVEELYAPQQTCVFQYVGIGQGGVVLVVLDVVYLVSINGFFAGILFGCIGCLSCFARY